MIWIIGAGNMAQEYAKVLKDMSQEFIVIGRDPERTQKLKMTYPEVEIFSGGLTAFLKTNPSKATHAIVATPVLTLAAVTEELLNYGVTSLLVEKPGFIYEHEMAKIKELQGRNQIFIAYNRRFYSSVAEMQKRIIEDGGLNSFLFEFTEWSDEILTLNKSSDELKNWFLANSTHVVDLAFFVGGKVEELNTFRSRSLPWHPSASAFAGAGKCENNVVFSYHAGWDSPGRWSLEFLTKTHRYHLRPTEKLQIQKRNSVSTSFVEINDELDTKFKPGLYLMVQAFLDEKNSLRKSLCTFSELCEKYKTFKEMAGY